MKKIFVLLVLFAFLLTACGPDKVAGLASLPDDAKELIAVLITAGLTWVLLQLAAALKIDLSGYAAPLAAVIAPIVITLLESYLALIPPVFDDIVLSVIHFLVLLLGSIGGFVLFKRVKRKETKQLLA